MIGVVVPILWWRLDRLLGSPADAILSLRDLLTNRDFSGSFAACVASDPVWLFLLYWTRGYSEEGLRLSLAEIGLVGELPYITAIMVSLTFGRDVDRFIARGHAAAHPALAAGERRGADAARRVRDLCISSSRKVDD